MLTGYVQVTKLVGKETLPKRMRRWDDNITRYDERYQLDAAILFIIINNYMFRASICPSSGVYTLYTTAYGVQH
jgi:hypothetical protein